MADTYYTWSDIEVTPANTDKDKATIERKYIKAGTKVTSADLSGKQEEFDQLVEAGVLRTLPFPDMGTKVDQMSPVDYLREQAALAAKSEEEGLMGQLEAGRKTEVPSP